MEKLAQRIPRVALNAAKLFGVVALIVFGGLAAVKCAGYVVPFIFAYVIASIVEPIMRFMEHRLRIGRGAAALVAVLLVVGILAALLGVIAVNAYAEVRDFAARLPSLYKELTALLDKLMADLDAKYDFITPEMIGRVNEALANLGGTLMSYAGTLSKGVWHTATSLPALIVALIVTLVSTYFIARDRKTIAAYFRAQIPENWMRRGGSLKSGMAKALFGYVRALLILMSLTFCELFVGFMIIGVDYAVLFALLIAVLDALPVLGTGTMVVPWAIYNLLTGQTRIGIGLLIVFAIVWTVRQILEPRVVGNQIGMHPLLTLLSMYLGMQFIGVIGMLAGPVLTIIARNILRRYLDGRTLRAVLYEGTGRYEGELSPEPAPEKPNAVVRLVSRLRAKKP